MKRILFFLVLALAAGSVVPAQPAQVAAPPAAGPVSTAASAALPSAGALLPSGAAYDPSKLFIVVDTGRGAAPRLKPAHLDRDIPQAPASTNPASTNPASATPAGATPDKVLRIEALAVLPAPVGAARLSPPETLKKLALIMNSVHGMEGLEYWSASRQRMRTLYAEVYRVESPSNRAKLPDPAEVAIAGPGFSQAFYAYQRDLTFGGNVVKYEVRAGSSSIAMANENATPMRYFLIPLVSPGGMKSDIVVVPCKEGLLVHFLSTIDAIDLAAGRVFESAGNKSLAVLGWFARETAAAGLTQKIDLPINIEDIERLE